MFEKKEVNTKGLFATCFAMSEHKQIIHNSHLPFEDGFYVTEYNVVLKVHNHTIYALTEKGWEQNQSFFKLWYDSMTDFSDIPQKMVEELGLDKKDVVKESMEPQTKTAKLLTEEKNNATKPLIEGKTNMAGMSDCKKFVADAYLVEYCDFMKYFYTLHKEEYAKRLDAYYASPESRMLEENSDSPKTISEELYKAALEKTKEILVLEKEEGWDSLHNIGDSPFSLYEKMESWNRCVDHRNNGISYRKASDNNSLVLPMKEQAERENQLREIVNDLSRKRDEAVKNHWRPLTLVSGVRGEYNDVLFYDEELNLMIKFSPDDNYYHWGGYDHCIGLPTKGESYYDKEKGIRYIHCPLNSSSIEFEYSKENEERYHIWMNVTKEFFWSRC